MNNNAAEDTTALPDYFLKIPLKDRECKIISHCMRQSPTECDSTDEVNASQMKKEKEVSHLRERGNLEVKHQRFTEALKLYSKAIDLSTGGLSTLLQQISLLFKTWGSSESSGRL